MEKALTTPNEGEANADEVARYKKDFAEMFAEMTRLADQTRSSQMETQRLRTETREILARMKAA